MGALVSEFCSIFLFPNSCLHLRVLIEVKEKVRSPQGGGGTVTQHWGTRARSTGALVHSTHGVEL